MYNAMFFICDNIPTVFSLLFYSTAGAFLLEVKNPIIDFY